MRALALCALMLGFGLLAPVAPAWAGAVRVVILPIVVHSADPDSAYVSEGLADMISSRLERTGNFEVVRADDRDATTKLPEAIARGLQAGGEWVLFGAFTQFGDGASLDMQCAALAGQEGRQRPRRIFIQSGTMGEIIPKLDELVQRIAAHVGSEAHAEAPKATADAGEPEWGATEVVEESAEGYTAADELEALRQRVEALEQAVYEDAGYDAEAEAAIPEDASAALDEATGEPLPES